MQLEIYPDYETLSQAAANWLTSAVRDKPDANLVFAVGNTPEGAYRNIAAWVQSGKINLKHVRIFQLDDYLGVAANGRRSLYRWLQKSCLEPMDILPDQVVRLPGDAVAPEAACKHFAAQLVEAGGIDVAILGLGSNGHLGFNEPGSDWNAPTRVVTLKPESIKSNAAYWGSEADVPRQALTMGLDILQQARQTLLLVNGAHKAEILDQVINGPPTTNIPATCLRQALNVTVMADRAAVQF